MKRLAGLGAVVVCLAASGCASAFGTFVDPVPYAGTQLASSEVRAHPAIAIDMPASFVLDTALLPVTLPYAVSQQRCKWRFIASLF